MKYFFSILFSFSLFFSVAQKSIPKPNPQKLVNDFAGLLDKHDADLLERKLVALDDSTSNQIVVITVKSLNGEIIEDVALNTFREWGIGNKKTNNGVLLLIALEDKKIRIEVGYGLEGVITDVISKDIITNNLAPAFKQGNYLDGINKAVDNLSKAAAGEYKVKRKKNNETSGKSILLFIIILFVILMIVGNSGRGGGGNMINNRGSNDIISNLFLLSLLNSGSRGSSGGGNWGGSDWGGGGFGGFGGGSSGGGGASGGW
jgi:uncharacterized protein